MTLDKAQRRARLRYLAVCGKQTSYALDYYPNERARYLRELGREVIGDFATHDDAFDAAFAELRRRAKPLLCMICDHTFEGDLPTVVMIAKPFASRHGQMIVSPVCAACAAQGREVDRWRPRALSRQRQPGRAGDRGRLGVTETAKTDLVALYLEIGLADGARADDPRLALLADLMSHAEIKRAKEAIGAEWLRREPLARPN